MSTLAERLLAPRYCRIFTLSKVKRGPGVFYGCSACGRVLKQQVCPLDQPTTPKEPRA